jgi:hypothetical protein
MRGFSKNYRYADKSPDHVTPSDADYSRSSFDFTPIMQRAFDQTENVKFAKTIPTLLDAELDIPEEFEMCPPSISLCGIKSFVLSHKSK